MRGKQAAIGITGQLLLFVSAPILIPAFIYIVAAMLGPLLLAGVGVGFLWLSVKKEPKDRKRLGVRQ